jgi:cell wall assembly regulator SMI1
MNILDRPEMWLEFSANPPANRDAIDKFESDSHIKLPKDYKQFLERMNGGRGFVGDAFLALWRVEELLQDNKEYEVDKWVPGFFIFGSDGGGEAFGFDLRSDAKEVVCIPFIGMEWENAVRIAPTFTKFLEVMSTSWPDVLSHPHA